jgi:hypothetical protein
MRQALRYVIKQQHKTPHCALKNVSYWNGVTLFAFTPRFQGKEGVTIVLRLTHEWTPAALSALLTKLADDLRLDVDHVYVFIIRDWKPTEQIAQLVIEWNAGQADVKEQITSAASTLYNETGQNWNTV